MSETSMKIVSISKELLDQVPIRVATHYQVIPIGQIANCLKLGIAHGSSRQLQDEVRVILGQALEFVPMPEAEILDFIRMHYGVGADVIESLAGHEVEGVSDRAGDIEQLDQSQTSDASMTKLVHELILEALKFRASDIHIEPFEKEFRIRYRVDGLLRAAGVSNKIRLLAPSLISRIKIMAKLDIGEKRLPQDGRIKIRERDQELDLRVSVVPSSFGEAIVIRILRPLALLDLEDLGFEKEALRNIHKVIDKPQGMVLVTGPTGSGKTTTLYACLKAINQIERKILTIEDPVEYKLPGIIQMQANAKIGFTFAQALRSILRHDPDCIMVGEIRDAETAKIAVSSAMTGHLVFSTLHTNDAPSAVSRLIEMGIEPYLVASSLEAVIAQRLVRKLCTPEGFVGRIAIYEYMKITPSIRELILEKGSADAIRNQAMQEGMIGLYEEGMRKVNSGRTTIEEVQRVVASD